MNTWTTEQATADIANLNDTELRNLTFNMMMTDAGKNCSDAFFNIVFAEVAKRQGYQL